MKQIEEELSSQGINEKKLYLPNVTSRDAFESLYKAYYVKELGNIGMMVDILTAGYETVQILRNAMKFLEKSTGEAYTHFPI